MNLVKLSKEISYALRHAPWEYELELDEDGFVPILQLVESLNETQSYDRPVTIEDLKYIIETSDKKRHEISGDRIRAIYGHSVPKKISRTPAEPPEFLYHGTSHEAAEVILETGLKSMGRQFVHLSVDTSTAYSVGLRRDSNPMLLRVDADKAACDGIPFYEGNDKVWLADYVPCNYLSRM